MAHDNYRKPKKMHYYPSLIMASLGCSAIMQNYKPIVVGGIGLAFLTTWNLHKTSQQHTNILKKHIHLHAKMKELNDCVNKLDFEKNEIALIKAYAQIIDLNIKHLDQHPEFLFDNVIENITESLKEIISLSSNFIYLYFRSNNIINDILGHGDNDAQIQEILSLISVMREECQIKTQGFLEATSNSWKWGYPLERVTDKQLLYYQSRSFLGHLCLTKEIADLMARTIIRK